MGLDNPEWPRGKPDAQGSYHRVTRASNGFRWTSLNTGTCFGGGTYASRHMATCHYHGCRRRLERNASARGCIESGSQHQYTNTYCDQRIATISAESVCRMCASFRVGMRRRRPECSGSGDSRSTSTRFGWIGQYRHTCLMVAAVAKVGLAVATADEDEPRPRQSSSHC
jgi:hypothetical protein